MKTRRAPSRHCRNARVYGLYFFRIPPNVIGHELLGVSAAKKLFAIRTNYLKLLQCGINFAAVQRDMTIAIRTK